MSYARSGLGETYQVDLPLYGKGTVTFPTSQMVGDAVRAAGNTFSQVWAEKADSIAAQTSEALSRRLPQMIENVWPTFDEHLDSTLKQKKKELITGVAVAGGVAVIAVIAAAYAFRGK